MIEIALGKSRVGYDPDSGEFRWIECCRKPRNSGEVAGRAMPNGYLYIKAAGRAHSCSRLAWQAIHGEIPEGIEIDHIDRDRGNNAIVNLRLASRGANVMNRHIRPNAQGARGVSLHVGGLYRARFRDRVTYHQTKGAAARAYYALVEDAGLSNFLPDDAPA